MLLKRYKKLLIWSVVLLALAGAGLAGYIIASNEPRVVETAPEPSDMPAGADDTSIEKGAMIEWCYEYGMCSHNVCLTREADKDMTGLKFSEFRLKYPDVRIISFEPDKLSLKKSFDCYCPRHFILRKHEGGLAVMRTLLGSDEQDIILVIPVSLSSIEQDEMSALEAGKLFDSIEEIELYIEKIKAG